MDLLLSIATVIIGVLLLVYTVHIALTILGWVLIIGGAFWVLKNLLGRQSNRTDL